MGGETKNGVVDGIRTPPPLGSQLKSPLLSVFMSRFFSILRPSTSKSIAENFIRTLHYVSTNQVPAAAAFFGGVACSKKSVFNVYHFV